MAYRPDPKLLGLLNVSFVASAFDLPVKGLEIVARFGETQIYTNTLVLPRAWVQPEGTQIGDHIQPAEIVTWSPNRIEVIAEGPGSLILSEITYPGWQVWVDGQRKEIQIAEGLLRSIDIDSGKHAVTFIFRPISLYFGITFFLIGILVVAVCSLRGGHKRLNQI